jgi:hypothetical protein
MKFYIDTLIGEKPHLLDPFNYIKMSGGIFKFSYVSASILRIECEVGDHNFEISELKLTNNPLRLWIDFWQQSGLSFDPKIEKMNLSNNSRLELVSILESRPHLLSVDLSHNSSLSYVNLMGASNLSEIIMDGCPKLTKLTLGKLSKIQKLSFKNCNLREETLQDILGAYAPTITTVLQNKKSLQTSYVDLRGNDINWANRRIASKIRMLLTNNILVLWDNNPPNEIIPISYYKSLNIPWQI